MISVQVGTVDPEPIYSASWSGFIYKKILIRISWYAPAVQSGNFRILTTILTEKL
jgi:hypothetical protein